MYAAMFLLPLYYQQLRGETVLRRADLIPQGVGSLAARVVVGKLVDGFGARAGDDRQLPAGRRGDRPVRVRRPAHRPVAAGC